ncbi:mCG1035540 [Mus musculus]|nr:mCG1035540 [Mus musculus]
MEPGHQGFGQTSEINMTQEEDRRNYEKLNVNITALGMNPEPATEYEKLSRKILHVREDKAFLHRLILQAGKLAQAHFEDSIECVCSFLCTCDINGSSAGTCPIVTQRPLYEAKVHSKQLHEYSDEVDLKAMRSSHCILMAVLQVTESKTTITGKQPFSFKMYHNHLPVTRQNDEHKGKEERHPIDSYKVCQGPWKPSILSLCQESSQSNRAMPNN